jgi:hypothetical protein
MVKSVIQVARSLRRHITADQSPAGHCSAVSVGGIFLKKAVIVRVSQGLANQMICYKAARMVSSWNNSLLILDASPYGSLDGNGNRNFQLHHHRIRYDLLTFSTDLVDRIQASNAVYSVTKEMLLPSANPLEAPITNEVRKAPIVLFDFWFATFLRWDADRHAAESGALSELVLDYEKCFQPRDYSCMKAIESAKNPVAIHVRRGDYATHDGGLLLPADYYNRSIQQMERQLSSPSFFVFSDDIPWCRENLVAQSPFQFVDWNDDRQGYKDLFLASRCRHFILSNESTFSHQIVQLAEPNPDRIVITSTIRDVIRNPLAAQTT